MSAHDNTKTRHTTTTPLANLAALLLLARAHAHGFLTSPPPRTVPVGVGPKFTPFADARNQAAASCGENYPTLTRPTEAYLPGAAILLQWDMPVPHPLDNLNTGVRIAVHYANSDSFDQNVIAGFLEGDPLIASQQCPRGVGACPNGLPPLSAQSGAQLATLPAGKTGRYVTVQWVWAARNDNGFYMSCADIAVTADGLLPDYDNLPLAEQEEGQGRQLALGFGATDADGNLVDPLAPAAGGSAAAGGSVAIIAGAVAGVLAVGGALFLLVRRYRSGATRRSRGMSLGKEMSAAAGRRGGGAAAALSLPPGWAAAIDPSTGREYYCNASTGQTTWIRPANAPPPPQKLGAAAAAAAAAPRPVASQMAGAGLPAQSTVGSRQLPPGWTEMMDARYGKPYYVNSVTGDSTWVRPGESV